MTYPDSVRFLYSLGNEVKTAKLGLDRIRTLLAALGNPQERLRFVHVAGTNGKGSTCAMIEAGLRAAGYRTGLYTSPHLIEPTERIQIDNQPVTHQDFTAAFDHVHAAAERLIASGELDYHPTYFETVTAMAFLLFEQHLAEIVALEVGLGGRLDATNVVTPELCVITPVDFDHESWLGNSIPRIAFEKAGILKPGVPAVVAPQRPEAIETILNRAAEVGAPLRHASDWPVADLDIDAWSSRFHAGELEIVCPLAGEHQVENARLAGIALSLLGAGPAGIARTRWPGRLERVRTSPDIVLDGAHNPAGARALASYLTRFHAGRTVRMIFGVMRDKSVEEIAGVLFPHVHQLILTAPEQPRAFRPEALARLAAHPNQRIAPNLRAALAWPIDCDFLLITGSLYLVGEARSLFVQ